MGYLEPVLSLAELSNTSLTADRLLRLQQITARLSAPLTLREVAEIIITQGLAAVGAYAGSVALLDPLTNELEVIQSVGYSDDVMQSWKHFTLDSLAPLATAIKRSESIWISSPAELRTFYPSLTQSPDGYNPRSKAWASLPLLVEDRNLGGIGLSFSTEYEFKPADKSYMITLARQCAQAIDRALLFEKQQKILAEAELARQHQTFIAKASLILSSSLDYFTTIRNITRVIVPELADWCTIDLLNEDGTLNRLNITQDNPPELAEIPPTIERYPFRADSPLGNAKTIRTGQTEFVPDISDTLLKELSVDSDYYRFLIDHNLKSYMAVPLRSQARLLGTISLGLQKTSPRTYTQDDLQLVEDLAFRIAMSIDNARLYAAAQTARQQTARLQKVAASLSAAVSIQQIGQVIGEHARVGMGAILPTIVMLDESGQAADILYTTGYSLDVAQQWQHTSLDTDLPIFETIRTGRPVLVENLEEAQRRYPILVSINEQNQIKYQAWACFPLKLEGKSPIGAVGLTFAEPQQFTQDELDFVSAVCDYCSQAMDRVKLYEIERSVRQQAELSQQRLSFLAKAGDILNQSLDYQTTLQAVVELSVATMAHWCSLYLLEDDSASPEGYAENLKLAALTHRDPRIVQQLRDFRNHYPLALSAKSTELIAKVIQSGQSEILDKLENFEIASDFQLDNQPGNFNDLKRLALNSALIVPVKSPGKVLGVLTMARATAGDSFSLADLELAEELALRAGQAVTNARLVHSLQNALKERHDFLNVAAHELKTPITTLKGYTQLMLRQLKRPGGLDLQRVDMYLRTIELQSDKLSRLIGQLLDVSRLEAGKLVLNPEMTDAAGLVEEVVEFARTRSEVHKLIIINDLPEGYLVLLDAMRFEQVLTNLIDNALKYSPQGGEVLVHLSLGYLLKDRATYQLPDLSPEPTEVRLPRMFCMSVSDQGVGIASDKRAHIFEQFYQAHQDHHMSGMGLGLFITRQIVELHGGLIEAQFPPEGGTCVVVQLPLERADLPQ